ncbi:MAG: hypothetical protein KC912_22735 [Proteobacteria bacterium]|nr:hypothetical protein [Pseudomonadota bacterium]
MFAFLFATLALAETPIDVSFACGSTARIDAEQPVVLEADYAQFDTKDATGSLSTIEIVKAKTDPKDKDWILFFDEADAIHGKRVQGTDPVDAVFNAQSVLDRIDASTPCSESKTEPADESDWVLFYDEADSFET